MNKVKLFLWLVVAALVVIFALENWSYPNPPIRILGLAFLPLPHSLIIYSCLVIGFLAGWLSHVFKIKRERREAAAAEKPAPEDAAAEPAAE